MIYLFGDSFGEPHIENYIYYNQVSKYFDEE